MKVLVTEEQLRKAVKRSLREDTDDDLINNILKWTKDNLGIGGEAPKIEKSYDDPEKADFIGDDVAQYFHILEGIDKPITQQSNDTYQWQQEVESVQIGLELLGYHLPKFGVDGLFGPETAEQVNKFRQDNKIVEASDENEMLEESATTPGVLLDNPGKIIGYPGQGTHAAKGWPSHNAWDVSSPEGAPVYSLTDGTVVGYKKNDKLITTSDGKRLYGDQLNIKSSSGPDVFYTHINSNLKVGDKVKKGDVVGNIMKIPGMPTHVHVGLSTGTLDNISDVTSGDSTGDSTGDVSATELQNPESAVITPEFAKVMVEKLKSKGVTKDDLDKYIDPAKTTGGDKDVFSDLDVTTDEGYNAYEKICENYIESVNPTSPVTAKMLADAAKSTFVKYAKYIPPELALAQLSEEGGLSKDPNAKPIRTKNPYNIGNVDSGAVKQEPSFEAGVQDYYKTIATRYMIAGRTAADLIRDFKNVDGNRYASGENYETDLASIIRRIRRKNMSIYQSLA